MTTLYQVGLSQTSEADRTKWQQTLGGKVWTLSCSRNCTVREEGCSLRGFLLSVVLPYAFFGSFVDKRMYLQAQNIEIGAMLSSKFLITSQGIGESIETPIIERIKGEEESSPTLAIGFVGGRVHPDDMRHIEVQLARHLQHDHPLDANIAVFANHQGEDAYKTVLRFLDRDKDGEVSAMEKRAARVVIYGHSWGASQTVALAQRLERNAIPVLLTVQVDSVGKFGEDDGSIPSNVAQAINFYQRNGLLHGRPSIHAVDPANTRILGNLRLDYSVRHIDCRGFPWFARTFMLPHIEIENDPYVWGQICALIDATVRGTPDRKAHMQPIY
jgi:hypothetical protein